MGKQCGSPSRQQWLEMNALAFLPKEVVSNAEGLRRELLDIKNPSEHKEAAFFALHDALLEAGLPEVASHFHEAQHHGVNGPSRGHCWAIRWARGVLKPAEMFLGNERAAEWLGLSLSGLSRLLIRCHSVREFCGRGQPGYTREWMPERMVAMYDNPVVAEIRNSARWCRAGSRKAARAPADGPAIQLSPMV